jgi:cob(I)alamin adenosyltransferase
MRLTKITTRTGDDGTTGLADGSRLNKDDARITAIGSVDELNSQLGLLLSESLPEAVRKALLDIQHELFDLGGALATPGAPFDAAKLSKLDTAIVRFNADLPPLKEFILPGGNRAAALCHVARCIARRAEREYTPLAREKLAPVHGLQYLNRLSDLLFILCREINRAEGRAETLWHRS